MNVCGVVHIATQLRAKPFILGKTVKIVHPFSLVSKWKSFAERNENRKMIMVLYDNQHKNENEQKSLFSLFRIQEKIASKKKTKRIHH